MVGNTNSNGRPSVSIDGEKLRKLRIEAGHSQEKLAIMANVNRRTIQRAEAGEPVALETLSFIADALEVPLAVIRRDEATDAPEAFEPERASHEKGGSDSVSEDAQNETSAAPEMINSAADKHKGLKEFIVKNKVLIGIVAIVAAYYLFKFQGQANPKLVSGRADFSMVYPDVHLRITNIGGDGKFEAGAIQYGKVVCAKQGFLKRGQTIDLRIQCAGLTDDPRDYRVVSM
ncbi:MAG: helix-turn-helix transcriptional regulator [Pseudomonadota bacterium]